MRVLLLPAARAKAHCLRLQPAPQGGFFGQAVDREIEQGDEGDLVFEHVFGEMGGQVELVHGDVERRDLAPVEVHRLVLVQGHLVEIAVEGFAVEFELVEQGVQGRPGGREIRPAEDGELGGAAVLGPPQRGHLFQAAVDAEFFGFSVFLQQFGFHLEQGGAVDGLRRLLRGEHERGAARQEQKKTG